jgi:hypothetical protein
MAFIEQVELRSRASKIFKDSIDPLKMQLVTSTADQHYHDGTAWQDIDETFVTDSLSGFAHLADKVRHAIHVGSTGTRRWMPRRDHPEEYVEFGRLQSWSGTQWQNVNLGTATRTGQSISWTTTNFNLKLTNTWRRIKIDVVLKTLAAKRRLRWAVSLVGVTYNAGDIVSVAEGLKVGHVDLPIAWDANGSIDNQNVTITTTYSGGYIEFSGDLSSAVLPITIDPTFTSTQTNTDADTIILSNNTTLNYGLYSLIIPLYVSGAIYRALIKIDCIADDKVPAGSTITSASLILRCTAETLTTDRDISIYRSLVEWFEGFKTYSAPDAGQDGSTWAKRNANGSVNWSGGAGGASGSDWYSTATDTVSITGIDTDFTWDVTDDVTLWAGGTTNYGWWLKHPSETGNLGGKSFASSDHTTASYRPKLVVNYTTAASGPAKLKTWNGLATAKIKTINGLDMAKVKTINGLT